MELGMKKIMDKLMLITIFCFLYSCKYDKIEPKCEDLPPSKNLVTGYKILTPKYNYTAPSFNPSQPNEIVFYRTGEGKIDICTYNLQTNKLKTVYAPENGFGTGYPNWGSNNWIFFPMKDRNIWKINVNGDSLMQVTNNPLCYNPILNTKLHKMIYYHFWSSPNFTGNIFISDEKGNVLDSIKGVMQLSAWQNSDNIALFSSAGSINSQGKIQLLNPYTKEKTDIGTYDFDGNSENGLCWIDNKTLVYVMEDGIYKIDVPTQKTEQLRVTCETKNYSNPSYSPTLNKIVVNKTTKKIVGDNSVELVSKICLLNVNGKEESIIDIPE
jgi:hypothetical protein